MMKTETLSRELRLRLIGKALVGFDTERWSAPASAASVGARIGVKPKKDTTQVSAGS